MKRLERESRPPVRRPGVRRGARSDHLEAAWPGTPAPARGDRPQNNADSGGVVAITDLPAENGPFGRDREDSPLRGVYSSGKEDRHDSVSAFIRGRGCLSCRHTFCTRRPCGPIRARPGQLRLPIHGATGDGGFAGGELSRIHHRVLLRALPEPMDGIGRADQERGARQVHDDERAAH